MLLVFTLYALFASVFTVLKGALEYADPFFLVGSRMLLSAALMLGYAAWRDPSSLRLSRASVVLVLLLGIFNIYLTNTLEVWGLKYLTTFKTCFLYSLSPFLSALLSYLILRDILTSRKWLGLLVGFAGFVPILLTHTQEEMIMGGLGMFSWAEIAVFMAVLSSVFGWILLKQLVHGDRCTPVVANGYSMLFGGVLATIHSLMHEQWNPLPITNYGVWVETTIYLTLVSNILCYNLYGVLLKRFSPTFMAFAGLSTPIFTALFGWIFHGEVVSVWFFLSLAVVSIGLVIFYFEEIGIPEERKPEVPVEKPPPSEVLIPRST